MPPPWRCWLNPLRVFWSALNVPDDKLPLIKSLKVDYLKRATGSLRAVASLTPEQIQTIHTQEKGEVLVAVTVTDEARYPADPV